MRGFYSLPRTSIPTDAEGNPARPEDFGVLLIGETPDTVYLYSSLSPHPLAGVFGAAFLGTTWEEFAEAAPEVRDTVFRATVEREIPEGPDGEPAHTAVLTIPRADVLETDAVLADMQPPIKWAGDPDPEPVE